VAGRRRGEKGGGRRGRGMRGLGFGDRRGY
jgi:hypothetical protein